ncbi:hypothetical protein DVH02_23760 [Streptomyces corynorhini]|uniref:Secreted protein n=1 Tax=Streptomyces corynorhini TaxID=2282652 RepID=A0A370B2D7_9ACTN|nr:hypothetical protein DVH02_23760 [Streptomyces corynorhini]
MASAGAAPAASAGAAPAAGSAATVGAGGADPPPSVTPAGTGSASGSGSGCRSRPLSRTGSMAVSTLSGMFVRLFPFVREVRFGGFRAVSVRPLGRVSDAASDTVTSAGVDSCSGASPSPVARARPEPLTSTA